MIHVGATRALRSCGSRFLGNGAMLYQWLENSLELLVSAKIAEHDDGCRCLRDLRLVVRGGLQLLLPFRIDYGYEAPMLDVVRGWSLDRIGDDLADFAFADRLAGIELVGRN